MALRTYPIDVLERFRVAFTDEVPLELKGVLAKEGGHHPPPRGRSNWRREPRLKKSWLLLQKNTDRESEIKDAAVSILNRMSEDRFEENCRQLMELDIETRKELDEFVEVVFSKAIYEPRFSGLYADLCRKLIGCYIEEDGKKLYFRELMLNRCQQMFEKSTSIENNFDKDEQLFKFKAEVLGCIGFIGELYCRELLTDSILYRCFAILHMKIEHRYLYTVDSICHLMTTVHSKFASRDHEKAAKCVELMRRAKSNPVLSKKEQFAIMDVLDEVE